MTIGGKRKWISLGTGDYEKAVRKEERPRHEYQGESLSSCRIRWLQSKKNMSTRYQKDCMVFSRQFVVWKGDIPAKSVTNQLLVEFDNWMRYEKIML